MNNSALIVGADQLVSLFGSWPTFHDADVIWIHLDRRASGEGYHGPTVESLLHTFQMTSEVSSEGYYILRHHVLVHLRFREVVELKLDEFNCQNALWKLDFVDLRDRQMERINWEVQFMPSSYGMGASFQCHSIEVVGVTPCNEEGEASFVPRSEFPVPRST